MGQGGGTVGGPSGSIHDGIHGEVYGGGPPHHHPDGLLVGGEGI